MAVRTFLGVYATLSTVCRPASTSFFTSCGVMPASCTGRELAAHGVLVIIYFNIKEAELAYERYARGALVRDEMLSEILCLVRSRSDPSSDRMSHTYGSGCAPGSM